MEPLETGSEYSRRALARLAFSVAAAQLADQVRRCVPTNDDSWSRPGELLDAARALVVAAEDLLGKAVVVERANAASWTTLGEVLGVSKQGAQQKYGALPDDWAAALDEVMLPEGGALRTACLPGEGPDTPAQHAARLDEWVLRHADKHRPKGNRPVSGGLAYPSETEQLAELARLARRMAAETNPSKRRAFHEYKAALLTRLAKAEPGDPQAAEAAESARRELAALPSARANPSTSKAGARKKNATNLRLVPEEERPGRK